MQRAENRLWYVDLFRDEVFIFNGRAVTPCAIPFAINPATIVDYVRDASRCDQPVVAWSGKHTYRVAQRYGRHVLTATSTYHPHADKPKWTTPRGCRPGRRVEIPRVTTAAAGAVPAQRQIRMSEGQHMRQRP
ncbi:hypothetical protein [Catenuloplanes atrovinosus]|uniref:Uncharacterized protein n=1 Tax=Catenuloplanes atrovinosus TaxID=137266 RepID=A0AAE3YQ31_9ACTN|nr:hypothetical protein [Catenuloplanes atrovinosus]MDR7277192.1 hypothetical protein [Catenuloplanes atrovinosus]